MAFLGTLFFCTCTGAEKGLQLGGRNAVKAEEEKENRAFEFNVLSLCLSPPQTPGALFLFCPVFYNLYHFHLWLSLGAKASVLLEHPPHIWYQGPPQSPPPAAPVPLWLHKPCASFWAENTPNLPARCNADTPKQFQQLQELRVRRAAGALVWLGQDHRQRLLNPVKKRDFSVFPTYFPPSPIVLFLQHCT